MNVTVVYFARARELAKTSRETVPIAEQATVADLRGVLADRHPALVGLMNRSVFAVDAEPAEETTILRNGAEVALIPPVSGG